MTLQLLGLNESAQASLTGQTGELHDPRQYQGNSPLVGLALVEQLVVPANGLYRAQFAASGQIPVV
jgi:hypothetical protein